MLRLVKDTVWSVWAWALGWGATIIRRCPCAKTAGAWRAVNFSYAHFGEDLLVLSLLQSGGLQFRGSYVDVGAFHPTLHSNTYLLYLHGWRGLNVDASAERIAQFAGVRNGDRNIVAAVSDTRDRVKFVEYPTAGTSRLAEAAGADAPNAVGERPVRVVDCQTVTLTDLLEQHSPPPVGIDFLNVDCEGADLAVLRGLEWSRWTPRVIAVEANTPEDRTKLHEYLTGHGYYLVAQNLVTLIFVHQSFRSATLAGLFRGL